jgi:hypothetical protein
MPTRKAKRSAKSVNGLKAKSLSAKQAKDVRGGALTVKQKFDKSSPTLLGTSGLPCDGGSKDPAY